MDFLRGRVAVVTGGGRGIGAAIAAGLASQGAEVVISGRNVEQLDATAASIAKAGGKAHVVRCDVASAADVARLVEETHRLAGPAAIVVNNAGVATSAKLADTDEALWQRTLDVNLTGAYRVTRAFLADVVAAGKRGRIVYVASVAAKHGMPYTAAYSASKHGLLGLARSLSAEIGGKGPTVNCLCPGWVDTDMAQLAVDNIAARTGRSKEAARRELELMSPQRRLMTVDDVAAVALFLASDAAAAVNGQGWNVDGGQVQN